jgi:hypothetical protein
MATRKMNITIWMKRVMEMKWILIITLILLWGYAAQDVHGTEYWVEHDGIKL